MSSLENSTPSIPSLPSMERSDLLKKDDGKKKSRRLASRVLTSETKAKPDTDKPLFNFDLPLDKKDEPNKTPESSEIEDKELPLEDLSQEEEQQVAKFKRSEARDARTNETEADEADYAVHEALDSYDKKVIDEAKEPELAFYEVLEDYGIDVNEVDLDTNEEEIPSQLISHEIDLSTIGDEGEVPLEEAAVHEDFHSEPETPITTSGGGGGSKRPPTTLSFGGGANPPRPNPWRSSRTNPNTFPPNGLASPVSYNHIRRDHRDYWSGFMTGGIVGYFVGHRRGRIKTEKKLESVKKSLEKRVNKIDKQLKVHEYTIRKLVKEKVNASPERSRPVKQELPYNPRQIKKELAPASIPATEIHIGKLVMSERPREVIVHEPRHEVTHTTEIIDKKAVRPETMSNQELLKYSENVIIEGSSLREIYESQLVGEKGLRRLVSEYVHDGDLKETLKREILERQIDFERDPAMRDVAVSGSASVTGTGQKSLEKMIKKAESALSSSQEEIAFLKAKAAHDDRQNIRQSRHARSINAVFLSIIAFLVIVIILLSFLRHG